ncbi:tRNA uridine-5-carboxymethylaminomethyl(34) synthesis GTPase MnmE [Acidithiobacillus sp.]|uniref:tRNA uridine-5-carboxymethylaminomethyl(34) synthesis GTPase MnmE n=1 Tax=Acidithiobacillus sp. TaxID=1872118 RepID=UPI0025C063D9|nr:tRNA uridine-5-carboxymethylaminomethyl(34) synthesis GTPase MnmE [Acidithiobacillus sp.]
MALDYRLGDTIVAPATAAGVAGVGILRLSGPEALAIARSICRRQRPWEPRRAYLQRFYDEHGAALDQGLVLYFPGPHSFTGEDVVELHGHGSPLVLQLLQQSARRLGARDARPGEFSERAFLNGRMDLAQAEGLADLIHAQSEHQARAALASLEGRFSERVTDLRRAILQVLALCEAGLDFSEEDLGTSHRQALMQALAEGQQGLESLLRQARQGARLARGARVALIGRPNVGKSSLLNALAQRDSAIVTAIAGTTRDLVREELQIGNLTVELVDTAGLQESIDPVEREGIRRSRAAVASSQWVLLVVDAAEGWCDDDARILAELDPQRLTVVWNKGDLVAEEPMLPTIHRQIVLSARTGQGLDKLREELQLCLGASEAAPFSVRSRHVHALEHCRAAMADAEAALAQGNEELCAEHLRTAAASLGRVTGAIDVEEILGEIFSQFCIGK